MRGNKGKIVEKCLSLRIWEYATSVYNLLHRYRQQKGRGRILSAPRTKLERHTGYLITDVRLRVHQTVVKTCSLTGFNKDLLSTLSGRFGKVFFFFLTKIYDQDTADVKWFKSQTLR